MLKVHVKKGVVSCLGLLISHLAYGAADAPMSQPFGTISPFVFDGTDLTDGATAYRPLFDHSSGMGDIVQYSVSSEGGLSTSVDWSATSAENPIPSNDGSNWSAQRRMAQQNQATYWQERKIIFLNEAGEQVPFQWDALSQTQKNAFFGYESALNYLRGDRSNEAPNGDGYRARGGILGDIVHGNLIYVGPPEPLFSHNDYAQFLEAQSDRAPRLLANANDGMVHVFDVETGDEVFAYVPSMIMPNMAKLTQVPFDHSYLVDGHLTAGQVFANNQWRTLVFGALGSGGKGFFGLDLTDPDLDSEQSTERKILWELDAGDDPDIGYTHSQMNIARFEDGNFYVVAGNGYDSENGQSVLLFIDPWTGEIEEKIFTDGTGLSSPTLIDSDNNGHIDLIYAGDIDGNLHRYEVSGAQNSWRAHNGESSAPMFRADRPITQAPSVSYHPLYGILVSFGTGKLLSASDTEDNTGQYVFGIWDDGGEVSLHELLEQTVSQPITHSSGTTVRTLTGNRPEDDAREGWRVALPSGLRLISKPILMRAKRLKMTLTDVANGENWAAEFEYVNGGGYQTPIVDLNGDGEFDAADRVDGNTDGDTDDIVDVPMLWQVSGTFVSGPSVARLPNGQDLLVRNSISVVAGGEPPTEPPVCDECGPGLAGGHFDLDTDGKWGGNTDAHVHEYDDKTDRTYADFFDIDAAGEDKLKSLPEYGLKNDEEMIVLMANADLSPGAIIQIGNETWNALEYQRMIHEALMAWDGVAPLLSPEGTPLVVTPNTLRANSGTLRISFDQLAILEGGLHPTQTGCVRIDQSLSNLTNGRWRNGALVMQLVDKEAFFDKSTGAFKGMDPIYQQNPGDLPALVQFQDSVQSITINLKQGGVTYGGLLVDQDHEKFMQYEGTLFWHFQGACYGESDWAQDKANADEWISSGSDDGKKKKKKGDDDEETTQTETPYTPPESPTVPTDSSTYGEGVLDVPPTVNVPQADRAPGPSFLPGRKSWVDSEA